MSGRKRRIDDVDNSDNDNRKKQARVSNLGSGANSGQSSSVLNAEAVAKAPNTAAAVSSQAVSGEALGTKIAPPEAEPSRDKGKQRQEQVEEAKEAAKEAGISVDHKESTAGPSTEPSKQPRVKRQRRRKTDPVPDPVEKALSRIENNPTKRTDRACDNCRVQKLKCDNDPDGCAQCVKRSMQCTLTLATQKTYVRGAPRETGQARDGLNLEVERLRADVNLLQQDVVMLRRDIHLLRQENMQLRRVLAGSQTVFPNYNQFPWNPPPAGQAPPHAPYEVHPQAQAASQGAGYMPLPVNFPPAGHETLYPELPANPSLAGQGAGYLPFPGNAPLAGPGALYPKLPASPPPAGQGAGNPAPPPNLPLMRPGLLNFPPAPSLLPVTQEAANFLPAPTTPPPGQGSPSVQSGGSSPYQTSSEASKGNDDTNFGITNSDPAFANQVVPPMTEQGGGQPALGAQKPGYQDTMADPTAMGGLDDDFLAGFVAQPVDLNDLNVFNLFNASDGDNGDNGNNGGDPIDLSTLPADRARLAPITKQPSHPSAANAVGPATNPLTIDPAQLNLQPVDYPQVGSPTTTLAMEDVLWNLQNGRDNEGLQPN
ncbi:hypothetical protein IFM51744_08114 [Aspergillus udagawae]|uniref:Zn(2)-C6 fungal-type domain-containing protein n=1 Tax=Aspergillus udagawae TaxID=91492 RepID=A0A8H3XM00_9EURO|nr:uncharacterized protein Aud_000438 [Aspergillus udagawae]GFF53473.1 hypothetical protein IFM51744_08114 [Aspergillus udagawae]GFF76480.1 hypothetical protein IFM53868_01847 [Aspergillus udagawae]GFG18412.1 hypothetical protein IFM5058_09013 [Aspergillus udagawae]GIC84620.1 hypothetical protein Aud_000438 [Aspergillus udagawae]